MLKWLTASLVAIGMITEALATDSPKWARGMFDDIPYSDLGVDPQVTADGSEAKLFREGYAAYTDQSYSDALKLYRQAAEAGISHAQHNLALMYYDGDGIPQDYAEAVKWFEMAAKQGDPVAMSHLGLMYANGEGVPQDFVLAHAWWNLAGARGDRQARRNRDIVAERMTPDQIGEAQRLAREWLQNTHP